MAEPERKAGETLEVRAFVDFVSPFSWLAVAQLDDIEARTNLRFTLKPVLLAALLDEHGLVAAGEAKAKRDHELRRIAWRASELGLDFVPPPRHPFLSLRALRAACAYQGTDRMLPVCKALFAAGWEQGRDLCDETVIESALRALDLDIAALEQWAESDAAKTVLRRNTEEALAAGAFGVPSFVTPDGMLFWGQDQLPRLEQWARGELPEESPGLRQALAMPVSPGRASAPGRGRGAAS